MVFKGDNFWKAYKRETYKYASGGRAVTTANVFVGRPDARPPVAQRANPVVRWTPHAASVGLLRVADVRRVERSDLGKSKGEKRILYTRRRHRTPSPKHTDTHARTHVLRIGKYVRARACAGF